MSISDDEPSKMGHTQIQFYGARSEAVAAHYFGEGCALLSYSYPVTP